MLLLLGGHNCIHGITYKVLSNIKLKWLHTPCTSPSEPLFSPSLPPVPLCCKVHIEVWKERRGSWHVLDLISLGCSRGPSRSACHFYPIYSSPGLIACFLSEEIFPVKALCSSFISPVFRSLSVEGFRDAFIPQASLLHTSANLSGSGSSKLLRAHKSNPAELLWCHYGSLKPLSFQLPIILLPLISSQALLFESGWWRGREGERNGQRPTSFGPRFMESVLVVAHPWHLHWVILSSLRLHFFYFWPGIGNFPACGGVGCGQAEWIQ